MSQGKILKPTSVTLCDLCNEEIVEDDSDTAHIFGYNKNPIGPKTARAFLRWPSARVREKMTSEQRASDEFKYRNYDMHGKCLVDALEGVMEDRKALSTIPEEFR